MGTPATENKETVVAMTNKEARAKFAEIQEELANRGIKVILDEKKPEHVNFVKDFSGFFTSMIEPLLAKLNGNDIFEYVQKFTYPVEGTKLPIIEEILISVSDFMPSVEVNTMYSDNRSHDKNSDKISVTLGNFKKQKIESGIPQFSIVANRAVNPERWEELSILQASYRRHVGWTVADEFYALTAELEKKGMFFLPINITSTDGIPETVTGFSKRAMTLTPKLPEDREDMDDEEMMKFAASLTEEDIADVTNLYTKCNELLAENGMKVTEAYIAIMKNPVFTKKVQSIIDSGEFPPEDMAMTVDIGFGALGIGGIFAALALDSILSLGVCSCPSCQKRREDEAAEEAK